MSCRQLDLRRPAQVDGELDQRIEAESLDLAQYWTFQDGHALRLHGLRGIRIGAALDCVGTVAASKHASVPNVSTYIARVGSSFVRANV
jgi:hypothetical protein